MWLSSDALALCYAVYVHYAMCQLFSYVQGVTLAAYYVVWSYVLYVILLGQSWAPYDNKIQIYIYNVGDVG